MKLKHPLKIAADHPAFAGHFPGMPILPGAVLLDEALHIVELGLALDLTQWQVATAKFLEIVRPGDVLTVEHTVPANGAVSFTVLVGDRPGSARPALVGTLSLAAAGGARDA
jgi:3-hydroxyacyl-[acyl-carrier-protein] dehydratase